MSFEERLQSGKQLSDYSTFGIGGPIRYFFDARSMVDLEEAFSWISRERIPYLILGKGSNSLFSGRGFDGLVIRNKVEFCTIESCLVHVGAGYSFSLLGSQTARRGLSGLEFACGIPGTVGGALFMNAGANGKETAQHVQEVLFLKETGEKVIFKEMQFGYRTSPFQALSGAIVEARFLLEKRAEAHGAQKQILKRRFETQPYKEKSVGCIFRNPSPQLSAGALIDRCKLKGVRVGGAKVSEIHANFIVNDAYATADDVKELIVLVQQRVFEEAQIHLEPEVRML